MPVDEIGDRDVGARDPAAAVRFHEGVRALDERLRGRREELPLPVLGEREAAAAVAEGAHRAAKVPGVLEAIPIAIGGRCNRPRGQYGDPRGPASPIDTVPYLDQHVGGRAGRGRVPEQAELGGEVPEDRAGLGDAQFGLVIDQVREVREGELGRRRVVSGGRDCRLERAPVSSRDRSIVAVAPRARASSRTSPRAPTACTRCRPGQGQSDDGVSFKKVSHRRRAARAPGGRTPRFCYRVPRRTSSAPANAHMILIGAARPLISQ